MYVRGKIVCFVVQKFDIIIKDRYIISGVIHSKTRRKAVKNIVVDKNSWHYWLYKNSYDRGWVPDSTNLCQYTRRIVFFFPLISLKLFVLNLIAVLFFLMFNTISLMIYENKYFPYGKTELEKIEGEFVWIGKMVRAIPITMIVILLLYGNYLLFVGGGSIEDPSAGQKILFLFSLLADVCMLAAVFMWGCIFCIILIKEIFIYARDFVEKKVSRAEAEDDSPKDSLLGEWIKAKKEKICPIITFVGGNESK